MEYVRKTWETENLKIADLIASEIDEAQQLVETGRYMKEWDGREYDPDYVQKCFNDGCLPPEGQFENYRIQGIRAGNDQALIGILSLYHGYPTVSSVYLEFLYLHQAVQKQGYGKEIVNALTRQFSELGYEEIRANVSIKNWSALRFWIRSGFNHVSGLYGDAQYGTDKYANLELIKTL